MRFRAFLCVFATICFAAPARADSDGWYCIGPGYLAFELQGSMGVVEHELRIIRVGDGGIAAPLVVPLAAFQVHYINCGDDTATLWGPDTIHEVDLTQASPSVESSVGFLPTHSPTASNLGQWSQPGVIEIPSADPDYVYQLVITKSQSQEGDAAGGVIEHYTQTQIWQRARDAGGQVIATCAIFHGIFEETID